MTKYKRGKISPFSLFAMFVVSRVLVVFTVCNVTSLGKYSSDLLISVGIGLALSVILSLPIVYLIKKNRNILEQKWLSVLYGLYFLFLGAVSIGRFSFFASMELNEQTQSLFLATIIIISCMYAAWLGIEPISRFGSFIFVVTIIGVISVVGFGMQDFSILNLFPFTKNSTPDIFVNALSFACETSEILLLLVLAPKVNGKFEKPFYWSIVLSFIVCALLFFFQSVYLEIQLLFPRFLFTSFPKSQNLMKAKGLILSILRFGYLQFFLKERCLFILQQNALKLKGEARAVLYRESEHFFSYGSLPSSDFSCVFRTGL